MGKLGLRAEPVEHGRGHTPEGNRLAVDGLGHIKKRAPIDDEHAAHACSQPRFTSDSINEVQGTTKTARKNSLGNFPSSAIDHFNAWDTNAEEALS